VIRKNANYGLRQGFELAELDPSDPGGRAFAASWGWAVQGFIACYPEFSGWAANAA
jgi:hypothetical protein